MFKITEGNTEGKGFQMTFENGWTVSVQFGFGNYCANRDNKSATTVFGIYDGPVESLTAEIAAWDKNGEWFKFEDGQYIRGYTTPDQVADLIEVIRRF